MPLPPPLSDENRKQALEKAVEARRSRAAIKESLKNGKIGMKEILSSSSDGVIGKMKVVSAIAAMPGVGRVSARRIMEKLRISDSRRLRGLGPRQKDALLKEFNQK